MEKFTASTEQDETTNETFTEEQQGEALIQADILNEKGPMVVKLQETILADPQLNEAYQTLCSTLIENPEAGATLMTALVEQVKNEGVLSNIPGDVDGAQISFTHLGDGEQTLLTAQAISNLPKFTTAMESLTAQLPPMSFGGGGRIDGGGRFIGPTVLIGKHFTDVQQGWGQEDHIHKGFLVKRKVGPVYFEGMYVQGTTTQQDAVNQYSTKNKRLGLGIQVPLTDSDRVFQPFIMGRATYNINNFDVASTTTPANVNVIRYGRVPGASVGVLFDFDEYHVPLFIELRGNLDMPMGKGKDELYDNLPGGVVENDMAGSIQATVGFRF